MHPICVLKTRCGIVNCGRGAGIKIVFGGWVGYEQLEWEVWKICVGYKYAGKNYFVH